MTSRVPDDIWRQIVHYIPENELKGLLEINASLFHLAMDARYRNVVLEHFDHAAHRKLQRLRDPAIAPRVRQLHVDMSRYPQRSHTTLAGTTEPRPVENHTENFKDTCIACSKSEGIIKAMVDTVCCFFEVVDFSISWRYSHRVPYEELLPFLTAAWNTFGSQLRKVALSVSLRQLQTVLCTSGRLDALEVLEIEVLCLHTPVQNDILATDVTPFINRSALKLRSLSIAFDGDSPYPSLFNSLGEIPKLESLNICMNFDSYGFSDERGLNRFLRNRGNTLRHVSWKSHRGSDWSDFRDNNPLIIWMKQNQSDESILSNLCALEFTVPAGAFGLAMGYIRRSADTLTSLVLSGTFLTGDQAKTMMSIFRHRRAGPYFQELSIQVEFLSPDVVSTIAQNFPCLGRLVLCLISVSGSGQDPREPENEDEELTFAMEFEEEVRKLDIRRWQLRDIGLTTICYTESDLDIKLMRVFAECVPSIKCFWGVDKVSTDNNRSIHL